MAPRQFASYRILKKLWDRPDGVSCFLADQVGFERQVELRLFDQTTLAEGAPTVKRFVQEFQTLARLDHPSIAPVLDLGCSGGKLFYTTQSRNAEPLEATLARGRFAADQECFLDLATQLTEALGHMHARDVVHRGLRPESVRFDPATNRGHVAEFEMIHPTDRPSLTKQGVPLAAVRVAAPEMAGEGPVDARADQFMLGLLLLSCLTRRDLATGEAEAYASAEAREALLAAATVHDDLRSLLRRLYQVDPASRFPDMAAVAQELERIRGRLKARQVSADSARDSSTTAGSAWASGLQRAQAAQEAVAARPGPRLAWRPWALAAVPVVLVGLALAVDPLGYLARSDGGAELGTLVTRSGADVRGEFRDRRAAMLRSAPAPAALPADLRVAGRYLLLDAMERKRPPELAPLDAATAAAARDPARAAELVRQLYLSQPAPDAPATTAPSTTAP